MGAVSAETAKSGLEAYVLLALTQFINMPEEEARGLCTGFYNNTVSGKEHCYNYHWNIVGRKPDAPKAST
ncbi:hypothetical protein EX30DRAFT_169461 [Ascodesmis nigricans]|uniref:Uncharacterized protein n=1 Tax=Ascodesmis nigricans TaxID=341454 RepID=A0A4S2MM45_9PEZI|nr:hypothetical protein EX30DRAFT_169461 [Ascodesmis nigricans]